MQLHNAYRLINKFKVDFPEKVFSLGSDFEFTKKGMEKLIYISDQFYLSENITEEMALEKAIRISVKEEIKCL